MTDFNRIQFTADRMIQRFGTNGILRRNGAPNSGSHWQPSISPSTDYNIRVILTDYTDVERAGTLIAQGDRKLTISARGLRITPIESDFIVLSEGGDSVVYSIVTVTILEPGGLPIVYTAQVRK